MRKKKLVPVASVSPFLEGPSFVKKETKAPLETWNWSDHYKNESYRDLPLGSDDIPEDSDEVAELIGELFDARRALHYIYSADKYEEAAERGDRMGMCQLAFCFEWGFGREENHTTAANWYRRAAEIDPLYPCAPARTLAWLYIWGKGVEQSKEKALYWFRKAGRTNEDVADLFEDGWEDTWTPRSANWPLVWNEVTNEWTDQQYGSTRVRK